MITRRDIIFTISTLLVIFLVTIIGKQLIMSNTLSQDTLPSSPVSQAISQAVNSSSYAEKTFVEGKDYTLSNPRYFDNQTWFASALELRLESGQNDRALIVLKQASDGSYKTVLGPGTSFTADQMIGFPQDVVTYINTGGTSAE